MTMQPPVPFSKITPTPPDNCLLFIDDEEGIRRSVLRALKKSAYTLLTAQNGEEGLGIVRQRPQRISTVITDYKMPGINGLETLIKVRAINPEITRIILTGYATMAVAIQATNEGIDGFLSKPFDNTEFRAKIHDICLRKRLRQFVSEPIYQKIQKAPNALLPVFHEASVLFADIRNFTRMSQGVSPEEIAAFLNEHFFTPMGEIAYDHLGTVDKHMGDAIMVVFGSPVPRPEDPVQAVSAAQKMQEKAKEIDALLLRENNRFRLEIGIGIATGNVLSGVLGSLRKKEYTSVGMAVNIASRLQHLAAGGETLISEETYGEMKKYAETSGIESRITAHPLPPVAVKGMDHPLTCYRVIG
ncbi:MAG: adenylate/guanylate cyclase domain-containing protein [Desulfobacterales bacterium]|jgi:adenylate cyclase|nr:adenylate/guanylate cyclase domain-containing protein [Desulfobacterales bacterium]